MDPAGDKLIKMVALGRPFNLGMFYDCRSDKLVPGITLWDKEKLDRDMKSTPQPNTDFKIVASESISDKASSLGVEASLKASFLSGLVSVEGSAKYLNNNKKSTKQARVTLQYETTTVFKTLTMDQLGTGNLEHSDVIDKDLATHVVTGILYGAQAFFVFDRETSEEENFQDIQGSLKVMIKKIPSITIEGSGSLDMKDSEREKVNKFSCTFHGDFILEKSPTTFEESVKVYQDLPRLLGPNKENAVPVTVYLLPLNKLDSRASKLVREISLRLVTEAQSVLEDFTELEMWCNDVLNSPAGSFSYISDKIKTFKDLCSEFKVGFQQKLAKKLPLIRGGGVGETALAEELKKVAESPFSSQRLKQWMEDKDEETNTIKTIIKQMENAEVVSSKNSLINKVCNSEKALVFVLTSLDSTEPFLSELEQYLKEPEKSKSDMADTPESERWYNSEDVIDPVRRKAILFGNFAEANKDNESVQFLAVGLADENHKGSTVYLYEDGFKVSESVELPSRPGAVTVGEVTHSAVSLTFAAPSKGAQSVTGYGVEFREMGAEKWNRRAHAEAGEVTVEGLLPNTEYSFRVRAATTVGERAPVEVFGAAAGAKTTVRTSPCGPPEDLRGTAYPGEIRVRWRRPAQVGEDVHIHSYIVEYGQTQETVQWKREPSVFEEKVISGLQADTSYTIRVLCDCGEHGLSRESSPITATTKDKDSHEEESKLLQQIQDVLQFRGESRVDLSEALCSALAHLLRSSERTLEELDVRKFNTTDEGKRRLVPAVRNCRKAVFANCGLSERHCEEVALALSSSPSQLRDLELSGNKLGDPAVSVLCAALKSPHCELSTLRLDRCGLSKTSCPSLFSALESNPSHLTELDLGFNNLTESDVKQLLELKQSSQNGLQKLAFANCGLSERHCEEVALALSSSPSQLRALELSGNKLGDPAVSVLCAALKSPHCELSTLRLDRCGLSKTSCPSLFSALESNPSHLTELDLGFNNLTESDVKQLLELKQSSQNGLQKLAWGWNP